MMNVGVSVVNKLIVLPSKRLIFYSNKAMPLRTSSSVPDTRCIQQGAKTICEEINIPRRSVYNSNFFKEK